MERAAVLVRDMVARQEPGVPAPIREVYRGASDVEVAYHITQDVIERAVRSFQDEEARKINHQEVVDEDKR